MLSQFVIFRKNLLHSGHLLLVSCAMLNLTVSARANAYVRSNSMGAFGVDSLMAIVDGGHDLWVQVSTYRTPVDSACL